MHILKHQDGKVATLQGLLTKRCDHTAKFIVNITVWAQQLQIILADLFKHFFYFKLTLLHLITTQVFTVETVHKKK